jgi:phosphate transport system substrate-binding protein
MKKIVNLWITTALGIALMSSCGSSSNSKFDDTPAKGEITVAVDESFQPVIAAEKSAFEQTYKYTKINLVYKPDLEAVTMLLNSKARMAVVARELTDTEKKVFDEEKIKYRSYKFAQDALALITNPANKDTLITVQELGAVMKGEKKKWAEVGKRGSGEEIVLVFDNASSSNLTYLMQKFGIDKKDKVSFFAMKSNKEVISYVKSHKNALGVIGVNWISDGDDPAALSFIKGINVMSVADKVNPSNEDYYQPFGYNVALKKYPLLREIKLILKEAHLGLGTGFLNYMCMDQGQLIAYKQGLIPLTRSVNIRMVKMGE